MTTLPLFRSLVPALLCAALVLGCKPTKQAQSTAAAAESGSSQTAGAPKPGSQKQNDTPLQEVDAPEGLNLGNKAPDLEFADPSGKLIKLSSLRGSVVLIDFWASWCGPCRMENPTVVEAAKRFADARFKVGNGFKIYSVSLDMNGGAWTAAIAKDGLYWPYHVSDLKGWSSAAAAKYGVNSIPTNVLINGQGIIIAKGLRGPALTGALEAYMVQ